MALPSQPHDTLFRAIVSAPPLAAALLTDYLPGELGTLLDPAAPPEHVEGTFIDDEGARSQCDALFEARLATGEPLHIYVLAEHKSRVDGTTPLQLLGYIVNIWRRDLAGGAGRLKPIVPPGLLSRPSGVACAAVGGGDDRCAGGSGAVRAGLRLHAA